MRKTRSIVRSRGVGIGLAAAVAVAAVVGTTGTPAFAAVAMTLSKTLGDAAGGYTITATTAATTTSVGKFPTTVAVEFQGGATSAPACQATYATVSGTTIVAATSVSYIGQNKIGITVPTLSTSTPKYSVCAYSSSSGGALIANATFTATTPPTVLSVSPSAGTAQGGTVITVTGTGFPTAATNCNVTTSMPLTVTLGGVALTNITCLGTSSFTAVTPPHAASGPLPLVVTSSVNGSVTYANAFSFSNGISITPNTAPNTGLTGVDVDVQGVGFDQIDFATNASNDGNGHIYLVNGTYDPTASPASTKSQGQTSECIDVLPVGDTEVICTLQLAVSFNPATSTTAIRRTTTADGTTTSGSPVVSSPTANFTAADVGRVITGTGIPANTRIQSVVDDSTAILSNNASATASGTIAFTIGGARTTAADGSTTSGSTTITSPTASFTSADVGLPITGTGVPASTVIASVTNSTTAVLSQNASATATGTIAFTLGGPKTIGTDIDTTSGSTTITFTANAAGAPTITSADIGRTLTGTGFQEGTIIVSITSSTAAVISKPASSTNSNIASVTVANAIPVPAGAYTLTVVNDGQVDANTNNTDYGQSVISSGSTFSVADY